MTVALFLMSEKGYAVLNGLLSSLGPARISMVIGARDPNVQHDYYQDIQRACQETGIPFLDRALAPETIADYGLAVSWQWLIRGCSKLIVLHDSLLPKYRGFAPIPNALVNGESEIGVTALLASAEYDKGEIIDQRRIQVEYPIKVQQAIQAVIPLYVDIVRDICSSLTANARLATCPQDESQATYSLWRDELDYDIDWVWDAERIRRFIDAVGYPYAGGKTLLNGQPIIVHDAEAESDVLIENRTAGKVIFMRGGEPVVVCGKGLLRITRMTTCDGESLLPLKKFRSRFGGPRFS